MCKKQKTLSFLGFAFAYLNRDPSRCNGSEPDTFERFQFGERV